MVGSDGKEICDLLVVCGDHVLIFSEKTYAWPSADIEVAWSRWYRKAIKKSADQIRGAERWISEFPQRIFLDPACQQPLPISFPPRERMRVHGIVVAGGAGQACKNYFDGGRGSLAINPQIKDDAHWNRSAHPVAPFWIGDVDSSGSFIHVLDDGSLDIIMNELDTITDFTEYLEKKAAFARSGRLGIAYGEEDLLAYYSIRINDEGDHDFTHPDEREWKTGEMIGLDGSHYNGFITNPQYVAKKRADQISYLWDALIRNFTEHMLAGTSIAPEGFEYDLKKSELAVREMALQRRFERRSHGEAIMGALEEGKRRQLFQRAMIPREGSKGRPTGFFLLTATYDEKFFEPKGGYDAYRRYRSGLTELYAQGILLRYEYLKRVVGFAMEPPGSAHGSSEDILYAERGDWTEATKDEIRAACRKAGIMRPDYNEIEYNGSEFPEVQRRPPRSHAKPMMKGRDRNKPCFCGSGRKFKACHGERR